jgi:hypothetical protein
MTRRHELVEAQRLRSCSEMHLVSFRLHARRNRYRSEHLRQSLQHNFPARVAKHLLRLLRLWLWLRSFRRLACPLTREFLLTLGTISLDTSPHTLLESEALWRWWREIFLLRNRLVPFPSSKELSRARQAIPGRDVGEFLPNTVRVGRVGANATERAGGNKTSAC